MKVLTVTDYMRLSGSRRTNKAKLSISSDELFVLVYMYTHKESTIVIIVSHTEEQDQWLFRSGAEDEIFL